MIRATGIRMTDRGPGPVAVEQAADSQSKASASIGAAARMESERMATNQAIKAQNKAGTSAAGAAIGGVAGSFFGPVGTMIGSALGGLIGRAF